MSLGCDEQALGCVAASSTISAPHSCPPCDAYISPFGTHGQSCKSSVGRPSRLAALNDITHNTLSATLVSSYSICIIYSECSL